MTGLWYGIPGQEEDWGEINRTCKQETWTLKLELIQKESQGYIIYIVHFDHTTPPPPPPLRFIFSPGEQKLLKSL